MAQKAATVVIENVVTELLREWQSQFHDLQFWWRPETSTTYVLYLVSEQFEDIFAEELQGLRDELQFALEAETDCFWKVIMLTPKDVKKIQADLKKDLEQLADRLREHAHAFGQLANRVPAAEVTFEEREWQDWLAQADRLASCLKEDAKRFYERFLLYRGWDNPLGQSGSYGERVDETLCSAHKADNSGFEIPTSTKVFAEGGTFRNRIQIATHARRFA